MAGAHCVLYLSRELGALQPLTPVAAGNALARPCEHAGCSECAAEAGCGWCSETSTCMQGGPAGPCAGGCQGHWTQGYCADWPCSHASTCDDCLATQLCGWCEPLQACMVGSSAQPLQLSCPAGGYRFEMCTGPVGNATIVTL